MDDHYISPFHIRVLESPASTLLKFLKMILIPAFPKLPALLLIVLPPVKSVNRQLTQIIFSEVGERCTNEKMSRLQKHGLIRIISQG
jgi:hypothetical protein